MNKRIFNIIAIIGGILFIIGLNSNPMEFLSFVIGGTMLGLGVVGRFTTYLDFPEKKEIITNNELKYNPIPKHVMWGAFPVIYIILGSFIGSSLYVITSSTTYMVGSIDFRNIFVLTGLISFLPIISLLLIFVFLIGNNEVCEQNKGDSNE